MSVEDMLAEKRKCKHKWVDMEDGTLDKFCVKCRKFAKQQMAMPMQSPLSQPLAQPMARETMEVPFHNGSEYKRITVYKDDIIKQMHKEIGLSIDIFSNAAKG